MASSKLVEFVDRLCGRYFSVVELRIREEKGVGDNSLLVRALDRFHRRLQAVSKVLPGSGSQWSTRKIVYLAGLKSFYLDSLTDVRQALSAPRLPGKEAPSLAEVLGGLSSAVLNQVKSVLAYVHLFTAKDVSFASKAYFKGEFCSQGVREGLVVGFIQFICQSSQQFCESVGEKGAPSTPPSLLLLLSRLCLDYESSTISYILTLADEQFLGQDQSPLTPVSVLCAQAREVAQRLLNHYVKLQGLIVSLSLLPQDQSPLTPVSVLCAQAREVAQRLLNHYVKLQGLIDQSPLTPVSVLCAQAREVAQRLLNHYVKLQGLIVSLSLLPQDQSPLTPKSVLCAQAREVAQHPQSLCEAAGADRVSLSPPPQDQSPLTPVSAVCSGSGVAQRGLNHYVKLGEDGWGCSMRNHYGAAGKDQSSLSPPQDQSPQQENPSLSAGADQLRQQVDHPAPSYTPSAPMDTNLLSNIQKLFSERIDIFSTVEFNKVSVLTGIIKISLKTLLECVRLRSFGRFGLQQIQVDCHYLQLYLWRFVSDENVVHSLLDEIVGSAAHRCFDPAPMEQSVIEVICERG
ncbi:vacuolar protein sorting-associated protein 51-like protein isoform X1 [Huso huso]|uniref:Vacuolar protein sorting-associated protein 51 homolog n=1 Tax=Huso huso TaxID=61971 RepID=A0ABR0Y161_HUSHU